MKVAVAIVGYRNPGDVAACLAALARSTYSDYEVVICENGGPAACADLVAAVPKTLNGGQPVRIVEATGNLGYAGGVNRAMEAAPDADAWWVLNPDTQVDPEAMAACVARLEKGDCDAVGCVIHLSDGRVQSCGGRWQRLLARAVSLGSGLPVSGPINASSIERRQTFLSGCSALVSRRFLEAVGPMREDYFLYCEEVEWFIRARARGMRLGFTGEARVLHDAGSTTGSSRPFREMPKTPVYLNERNRILLTRDCSPWLLPIVVPTSVGVLLLRFGSRMAWRQLGYALSGWVAGLLDQRGPPPWIAGATSTSQAAPSSTAR